MTQPRRAQPKRARPARRRHPERRAPQRKTPDIEYGGPDVEPGVAGPVPEEPSGYREMEDYDEIEEVPSDEYDSHDQTELRLRDAQIALIALSYLDVNTREVGDTEGVWGPESREALEAFQRDQELDVTGDLDTESYVALLAAYETALETQSAGAEQDDFSPIHAEKPLND